MLPGRFSTRRLAEVAGPAAGERSTMATWDQVRRYALALPGVTETTSRGTAAWTVNKNFFVWERPLRKSDVVALGDAAPKGAILGVRTADLEMKEAILRSQPDVFFTTPHFEGYPAVLVQLDKIPVKLLKTVIVEAWVARAPERSVRAFLANAAATRSAAAGVSRPARKRAPRRAG
jgi:hypothetical protein